MRCRVAVGSSALMTIVLLRICALAVPLPQINSLSPTDGLTGSTFLLQVNGSNFVPGSLVRWNSLYLQTSFVSTTKLSATVTAANSDKPGTETVAVVNPTGSISNDVFFKLYVPCGQSLASWEGTSALSNERCQGYSCDCLHPRGTYGDRYQCTEFVKRFFNQPTWTGDAHNYFSSSADKGLLSFQNPGLVPPAHDDILAFEGDGHGHVAIVTGRQSTAVEIIEQNWSWKGTATLPITNAGGMYSMPTRNGAGADFVIQGW